MWKEWRLLLPTPIPQFSQSLTVTVQTDNWFFYICHKHLNNASSHRTSHCPINTNSTIYNFKSWAIIFCNLYSCWFVKLWQAHHFAFTMPTVFQISNRSKCVPRWSSPACKWVFISWIFADYAGSMKLIFRENSDLAKVDRVKTFACDAKSAVQPRSDD